MTLFFLKKSCNFAKKKFMQQNLQRKHQQADTNTNLRYIAKTFSGMEEIAAAEIEALGAKNVQILYRAVSFEGNMELMYKVNYCCRTILRVLMPLSVFHFTTNKQFYQQIFDIPFEYYLRKEGNFCIHSLVNQSIFSNSQYASLLAKDAVCDRFRHLYGSRPNVDKVNPDISIDVYIHGQQCSIALNSSGESLHRRGYKTAKHPAALSEVLAAGLIALSGWGADCDFIDFMCGSATLPIEAAMLATCTPAGYFRKEFGFMKWKNFNHALWQQVRAQAHLKICTPTCKIYGGDISLKYIRQAKDNIREIGFNDLIILNLESFQDSFPARTPAHIIINPPYGERMDVEEIDNFYHSIGNILKQKYINTITWVFSSNKTAMKCLGLHPSKKLKVFNAALECMFWKYELYSGSKKQSVKESIK
jgi:putative N6-adenine-specific DNA methylase